MIKNVTAIMMMLVVEVVLGASAPAVKNVKASQNPTTRVVDIYYDLEGPASCVYNVSIEATSGGMCLPTKSTSGHIGKVKPGKNKHIVWRAPTDWPNHKASDVIVSVKAELTAETPSSYSAITQGYIAYAYESDLMKAGKFPIKANKSASGSPPEQYFIYKTVQGKYGKFIVKYCWCGTIDIDFVTYDDDGKVYKKGSVSMGYESGIDFETGATSKGNSSSLDMKCFWDDKKGGTGSHSVQAYGAMKKMR